MRRWQAIPVAVVALSVGPMLAVGALMFTSTPDRVSAAPTPIDVSLDCGNGLGVDCNPASGTTSLDVHVVLTNNTGASISVSAFGFSVTGDNQAVFTPTVPGSCSAPAFDCNPDFNQAGIGGGMNCGAPLPQPDANASATLTESVLGCNTGSPPAAYLADGSSIDLGIVHATTADGVVNLDLKDVSVFDDTFTELGSCNPTVSTLANCFGVGVQIGSSAATNTPIPTSTNTAIPTATFTPCVTGCTPTATKTSEAFKTVTPTPGPQTATPATQGGTTPATSATQPPAGGQPGGTGSEPSGNAGAGGARPIRLPDTGSNTASSTGSLMLAAMATAAAGVLAGGLYFGLAVATDKRRREGED